MTVYIFENSYYVGTDKIITTKALRSEEVEVPSGKTLKIVDSKVIFAEDETEQF